MQLCKSIIVFVNLNCARISGIHFSRIGAISCRQRSPNFYLSNYIDKLFTNCTDDKLYPRYE